MIRRRKGREIPVEELERKHVRPDIPGYNDSSYFAGLSREGITLVTRQAFRPGRHNENWLKVHIPGEGVWGFENQPLEAGEGFVQGNLKYLCREPGKRWDIQYEGPVFQEDKTENIIVDLQWRVTSPILNFDKAGSDPGQVAEQIAKKPWSRTFFKRLHEIHLVHYEQGGELTGTVTWRRKTHDVRLRGVRDHSFGRREWETWRRHIWFLGILDDGRFFNISLIDYDFVNDLRAGFIFDGEKYVTFSKTPSFAELDLKSPLPHELKFNITVEKGTPPVTVGVSMKQFFPFTMDGVYHIREAKAEFVYGDTRGIGIAEMGVNLKEYGDNITG